MQLKTGLPNPWRWTGEVTGWQYLLAGVVLFAIKFALDKCLAGFVFDRPWTPIDYVAPAINIGEITSRNPNRVFYAAMMLVALPFTVAGLTLTVRRLRSAGLSQSLLLLFFVPVLNVLYFLILSVLSNRKPDPTPLAERAATASASPAALHALPLNYGTDASPPPPWFAKYFPQDALPSGIIAVLAPVPATLGLVMLSAKTFQNYGWSLFLGMPFALGLVSSYLHGMRVPRSLGQCLLVTLLSLITSGAALFGFAVEGLGCLVMLLPLALPISLLGTLLGYSLQRRPMPVRDVAGVVLMLLIGLPAFVAAEGVSPQRAPSYAVTSVVDVDAPPAVVWRRVIEFPDLPPPRELVFRAGVAYPIRARIEREGPGAIRRCEFSTGTFVEPIEVWDAPRQLKFGVSHSPPPLREWSPYASIHPPHLDNFLIAEAGEFRLIQLPGGRTRLQGTTWYRHSLWPAAYWRIWSDVLIHRIHLRVLEHIKGLSERDVR